MCDGIICTYTHSDVSKMSCPSLLYPDHGVLRVKEGEATYGCEDDYALSGNKKRYCQRNGEWTGRDPSCVEGTVLAYS